MKKTIFNQHICNLPNKNSKKIFKKSFLAISILLANSMVYADCTGTASTGLQASDGSECIFNESTMDVWDNLQGLNGTPAIHATGNGTKVIVGDNNSEDDINIFNLNGNSHGALIENGAEAEFNNNIEMDVKGGTGVIARNNAKVNFTEDLTIRLYANGDHPLFGINVGDNSELNVQGDLSIIAEELFSGALISSSGTVKLHTADLEILDGGSGAGISIGESGNNSSNALIYSDDLVNITTRGNELTDAAILGKYKGTIDLDSANIQTQGGAGIYLSDANVNIRDNLKIKTESDKAYGIYIEDGSGDFKAGSGQITTNGDEAYGLFETKHSSNIERFLNLNITTHGKNADAVHLVTDNDINFITNSIIETTGEGSKGIFAQAGSGKNVNITLKEGASILTNGNGIDLSNLQAGSQSTIYNNGDITVTDGHYAILGGLADDNVKLLGGKVTGDIYLGDGNNSLEFSGGSLKGKVLFGVGNAHALLRDNADVSQMSRIEGGVGTNNIELSNIKLTGYTADTDDLAKGVNFKNWDNILLSGNTVFTQTGDLFNSNETNTLTRDAGLFNTNKIGTLTIASTATWNMSDSAQSLTIAGNVINSGIINVGNDAGQTGRVLSINGDYEGKGGTVVLNNLASGEEVSTDLLKIAGDAKGVTNLIVHNIGGLGDQTTGDGVEIVRVGGVSDSNAFVLNGAVTAGNYEYLLNKGNKGGTNQNWYLRSSIDTRNGSSQVLYNPALGTYLSNQTVAVQMFRQTLFDRLGSLSSSNMSDASESFYWMINRINHNYYKSIHDQLNNHINSYSVQLGGDIKVWALDNDDYFHLGIMGGYGDSRSRSVSNQTKTRTDGEVRGYTVGVYGTYFSNKYSDLGFYADMMSKMGWYRNDITGHSQVATKNYHSTVWSNSLELGYALPLITGDEYQLIAIPQGQFTYNIYNSHNQNDKNKLKVSNNDADGLDIRLGSRFVVKGISIAEPFLEANWLSTTAKNQLDFNGETYKDGFAKNRFETKLGLQSSYNENWKILMQVVGQFGKNNFHSYEGQLNVDYNF